ncbi:MAG: TIGR01458 family HAD-type hydrolase [Calditrichia bacterium]
MDQVKGVLIDIDGVLYVGAQAIPGAVEAIKYLQEEEIPFRLITNTTMQSRQALQTKLKVLGFNVQIDKIFSAPYAASLYLKERKAEKIYLFVKGTTSMDFKDFKITEINPEYIILGDLEEEFTYERLNKAFRIIMSGAKMIALQKNRFWESENGLTLDAGAYVALLEYATRKEALVIGKPSREFFMMAVSDMGLKPDEVLMVGDDVEVDVKGAQESGICGALVKTGKFREEYLKETGIQPDFVLESIKDLPEFLRKAKYK